MEDAFGSVMLASPIQAVKVWCDRPGRTRLRRGPELLITVPIACEARGPYFTTTKAIKFLLLNPNCPKQKRAIAVTRKTLGCPRTHLYRQGREYYMSAVESSGPGPTVDLVLRSTGR
eukprot:6831628-Pyramimonas_sp.AAC.1